MTNIIDEIAARPAPNDIATWWKNTEPKSKCDLLVVEEELYLDVYTSPGLDRDFRIPEGTITPDTMASHHLEAARKLFGNGDLGKQQFCNFENRRRIVANYVLHHPAMIAYLVQAYRLARDAVPALFIAERIYELFTGKEAFLQDESSRVRALVELALPVIALRVLRSIAPVPPAKAPVRPLDTPIWDLPPEGGGMTINGRWYTEHALERMAPDAPGVRQLLIDRAVKRLERLGMKQGTPVFAKCLERAKQKIDPRGISPMRVEAELNRPGSTEIRVITAKRGQVVVTVIPKKKQ